ncbi:hypothetical protein CK1_07010 [Ruminococcus sp. SR1/5]|nr:hypothetical protein CK1_07010 [Ruminococcus sp. SR1/5]
MKKSSFLQSCLQVP